MYDVAACRPQKTYEYATTNAAVVAAAQPAFAPKYVG